MANFANRLHFFPQTGNTQGDPKVDLQKIAITLEPYKISYWISQVRLSVSKCLVWSEDISSSTKRRVWSDDISSSTERDTVRQIKLLLTLIQCNNVYVSVFIIAISSTGIFGKPSCRELYVETKSLRFH